MSDTITKVRISLYKPQGFIDTHFVDTDDRGLAVKTVLALYDDQPLKCLNGIDANLCGWDLAEKMGAGVLAVR